MLTWNEIETRRAHTSGSVALVFMQVPDDGRETEHPVYQAWLALNTLFWGADSGPVPVDIRCADLSMAIRIRSHRQLFLIENSLPSPESIEIARMQAQLTRAQNEVNALQERIQALADHR